MLEELGMRADVVAISKLLSEIQEDHKRLEKSHEALAGIAHELSALCESFCVEAKKASVPGGGPHLQMQQQHPAWLQARQQQMLKLQMAMQRENLVFTSVSNVLKTRHDTAKNSISNIR
jgi:hypothetical protein